MIKTTKKINLYQLDKELNAGGLNMESTDDSNVVWAIDKSITDAQLQSAIDAHIAIDEKAQAEADKAALLAKLGITADEAKLLLS